MSCSLNLENYSTREICLSFSKLVRHPRIANRDPSGLLSLLAPLGGYSLLVFICLFVNKITRTVLKESLKCLHYFLFGENWFIGFLTKNFQKITKIPISYNWRDFK